MNDLPGVVEQLIARVEALERRVNALERKPAAATFPAEPRPAAAQAEGPPRRTPANVAVESVSAFSVLGRAMLGIAGAYLLRAAAQSGLVSSAAAAALGIPYAIAWMVFAVRTRAGAWFPATVYSATSGLILAPMLWELVFRFQILAPAAAAAVVAVYVSSGIVLAWRRNLTPVLWVANTTSVLIALSLQLATRSSLPSIAVLLLMLALAAFAESRNRAAGVRALNALAAAAAIWAAIYVYVNPPASRPDYPLFPPAVLMVPAFGFLVLCLGSVVHNTMVRGQRISALDIILTVMGFLLAAVALGAFGPPSALLYFGVLCLALAAAGYGAVYLIFDRSPAPRNYRVFSIWSAALLLAGCTMALPDVAQAPCFGLAAVGASALGARFSRLALLLHGAVFLAAAAAISGLAAYIFHALAGAFPPAPSGSIYFAFLLVIGCYAALPRSAQASWQEQTLQFFTALIAICTAAAFMVHAFMALTALRIQPGPHHLAFFRTISVCAATLALAYAGARLDRAELTRIANVALVLMAVKLIAEDLRQGHLAYIAASIFFFALTLIAVPRLARAAGRSRAAEASAAIPPAVPRAGV